MTALLLILLALVQPDAPANRTEAARLFTLGNALHAEGDFHGAAAAYERAAETGWTSVALEINLGNAYAEGGRLGRAVLHFERAHRLDPSDEAARHNLGVVRTRLRSDAAVTPPADAAGRWLMMTLGVRPLAALAFALYLAALALLGRWAWTRVLPPWQRRALVVLVPLAVLLGTAAVLAARYETMPRAVVIADAALRTAPTPEAASAGTVPEGTVLTITGRRTGWAEVRLSDGTTGWADTFVVEEV